MTEVRQRYRKLPGHRRGFLRGASVWLASDHLLSVRSYRVREEYKRFQLNDVQAIVVARCPRFHISTRSLLLALIGWLASVLGATAFPERTANGALGLALVVMFLVWAYVSLKESCRCYLLTAVSRDELPSVYRTWTARRFLEQVTPRIAAVQGSIEGNWVEALEGAAATPAATAPEPPKAAVPKRYLWSAILVGVMVASGVSMLATLHASASLVTGLAEGILAIEVAAVAGMFVQYARGSLPDGMRWMAIAAIVKTGLAYYSGVAIMSALSANGVAVSRDDLLLMPQYLLLRQIDAWSDLALAAVSLLVLARPGSAQ